MIDQFSERLPAWLDRASLPYRSRFLATSQGAIHYVDEGPRDAEAVLLVHGTPSWLFEYRHLIATLSRTRRVLAFDHLGFGLSERPRDFEYTPEAHSELLREIVERLELRRFALVVHDYGGPIALPLACEEPARISSLVVINSWAWPLTEDAELARAARIAGSRFGRFLYRWLNASLRLLMPHAYADKRKLTPAIHAQYLAPFRERDARVLVLWALARALTTSADSLRALWQRRAQLATIPALIVWGLGDRALPPRLLSRWREALPQAQVAELADVGHFPHEEAPERVAARLDEFLPRTQDTRGKLESA